MAAPAPAVWVGYDIPGVRCRRLCTYDTWDKRAALPTHEPWAWLFDLSPTYKAMAEQCPVDFVRKWAQRITDTIESPTACFVDAVSKPVPEEVTSGRVFTTIYRDQQDCVLWAAWGRTGEEVIVTHDERPMSSSTSDIARVITHVVEPGGVEPFFYRLYLEASCWHAAAHNVEIKDPSVAQYMELLKAVHSDPGEHKTMPELMRSLTQWV